MIGSKSQSQIRPAALGISLQQSTYGAVIPNIYGRTKGNVYLIWQNNLRQGASGKAAKKSGLFKKSPPGNLENVDFLLAHNPIVSTLQFWANQNQRYPLLFTSFAVAAAPSITVPDSNFYQILGVSLKAPYSASFTDYGATGGRTLTGVYEIPLWNLAQSGPNLTNGSADRYFPYYYVWQPGSGPTITLPQNAFGATALSGEIRIYYAQLDPNGSSSYSKKNADTAVPAGALSLTFEPVLGDGPEFSGTDQNGNPLNTQQRLYPQYAGLGSDRLDLGSSMDIPLIVPEVLGTFPLYPSGDADFADMVEDILQSGQTQAGFGADEAYTEVHHGLGLYEFPGAVQSITLHDSGATASTFAYPRANKAGNLLVVASNPNGSAPTVSDAAGSAWTARIPGNPTAGQVWTARSSGAQPGNSVTVSGTSTFWQTTLLEIGGVDAVDTAASVANASTVSITTSNAKGTPCYILAFANYAASGASNVTPSIAHWNNLVTGQLTKDFFLQYRIVYSPGTYTYTVPETVADGNPTQLCLIAFKCSQPPGYPRPLGNIVDQESLDLTRKQCRAYGLWGSLLMDSQQKASDWLYSGGDNNDLNGLCGAMNAAPVWSGFSLKMIPYAEQSMVGNGAVYEAPTAKGPVATPSITDFITNDEGMIYTSTRTAQVDVPNILQIQFPNRTGDYNDVTISEPETASIALYSPRKDSPKQMRMIQDPAIARKVLRVAINKQNYLRNKYEYTLTARWKLLEPMDLMILPADPQTGAPPIDVRITFIQENEKYELQCEAEPFVYGVYTPVDLSVVASQPGTIQTGISAGRVNAPVFLEPVPGLSIDSELWIAVSAPAKNYGGCQVYLSTDGGTSYNNVGSISGSSITGMTMGDWPASTDPDTSHDLTVDLTESNGALASYSTTDEDNFVYPSYVQGGSTGVPYELMTYAVASLAGANQYTLSASSGNHLRRAVDNAPQPGQGVDHPDGSRFAFVGAGTPLFKIAMDPKWIGQTLFFKFPSFNTFLGALESLTDAIAYPYTPLGSAGVPQKTPAVLVNGVVVSYDYFFAIDGVSVGVIKPTGV